MGAHLCWVRSRALEGVKPAREERWPVGTGPVPQGKSGIWTLRISQRQGLSQKGSERAGLRKVGRG